MPDSNAYYNDILNNAYNAQPEFFREENLLESGKMMANFSYESPENLYLLAEKNQERVSQGQPGLTRMMSFTAVKNLGGYVMRNEKATKLVSLSSEFISDFKVPHDENGNLISAPWVAKIHGLQVVMSETERPFVKNVYDISQTKGTKAETIRPEIQASDNWNLFLEAMIETAPWPVTICEPDEMPGNNNEASYLSGQLYGEQGHSLFLANTLNKEEMAKCIIDAEIAYAREDSCHMIDRDLVRLAVYQKFGLNMDNVRVGQIAQKIEEEFPNLGDINDENSTRMNQILSDSVLPVVSDLVSGISNYIAIENERNAHEETMDAEVFGIKVVFTDKALTQKEIPEGMYGYNVVGSYRDNRNGQPVGQCFMTEIGGQYTKNSIGTILSPKYISLNERKFLRLSENDLKIDRSGVGIPPILDHMSNEQLNNTMQSRIIQANEDVLWQDHGSRMAVYKPKDYVPYHGMSYSRVHQEGYEVNGQQYDLVYGARMDNGQSVSSILDSMKIGDPPMDSMGRSVIISPGDVVVFTSTDKQQPHDPVATAMFMDSNGDMVKLDTFIDERKCMSGFASPPAQAEVREIVREIHVPVSKEKASVTRRLHNMQDEVEPDNRRSDENDKDKGQDKDKGKGKPKKPRGPVIG